MPSDPHEPHRRTIRLQDYDYSQPGSYFVTICTQGRKWLFGNVIDGEMHLNTVGTIAQSIWLTLPNRFPHIELDQYVIMPNHLHGIITIVGAQLIAPAGGSGGAKADSIGRPHPAASTGAINCAPTLGKMIRAYKAVATSQIRSTVKADFQWQRDYYEHIVRKDGDLDHIRQYIVDNPARWTEDSLYREGTSW